MDDSEYDPAKDGHDSYYVAIAAKKARGDHRIDALEKNLIALERIVADLQKDIQDIRKKLEGTHRDKTSLYDYFME